MHRHRDRDRCGRRELRPRRCSSTGKRRFPDHKAAVVALNNAATSRNLAEDKDRRSSRMECRSYYCEDCNGFHLTSQPDRTPLLTEFDDAA